MTDLDFLVLTAILLIVSLIMLLTILWRWFPILFCSARIAADLIGERVRPRDY